MIKRRNRRGMQHIEVIMSFVIFIGFLSVLLVLFPVYKPEKSRVGIDSAMNGVLSYGKGNAEYVSIIINKSFSQSCFSIESFGDKKIIARDESGEFVNAVSRDSRVYIDGNSRYYNVYYSDYFEEKDFDALNCLALPSGDIEYEVGLIRKLNALNYDKILELSQRYSSNYSELKTELSVPENEDFGFIVYNLQGEKIFESLRKRAVRAIVTAEEIPIQMIYKNGTTVNVILNVQTW